MNREQTPSERAAGEAPGGRPAADAPAEPRADPVAADGVAAARDPSTPAPSGTRVLVVDDEPSLRRTLARVLLARGYDVLTAEDGTAALTLLPTGRVDVMLLDLMMPDMSGMDVLVAAKRDHPEVEVIMMTGFGDVETAVRAVKGGAYDFMSKPFASNDAVVHCIAKAAERKRLMDKTRRLEQRLEHHERFGEMIGSSSAMRQVYRMALGVAPTQTSVLILGESGTGKELVARAIHQHSPRAGRPFVAVNCSAIPEQLVESELFGHLRGAFTGASGTRAGLFEAADKGTLFLDEIADLPQATQVKLLRALQSGEIKPVGSSDSKFVDVRVIAATNADLKRKVTEGAFREDLYYRLNVIAIHVPPLRRRRDDIPLLAYHFLHKYAERNGRAVKRITPEALRLLRERAWEGNVRELENAIEHAVVLARGEVIVPGDLPFVRLPEGSTGFSEYPGPAPPPPPGIVLPADLVDLPFAEAKRRAIRAFEEAYVQLMLERTGGNVSEAARQSGVDRSNFRRVIKKGGSGSGGDAA
jgi:two-component system response regulator HydG